MKFKNNKMPSRNKRTIFLIIAITFMMVGTGFFIKNMYHYARGYFAYKTISADEWTEITPSLDSSATDDKSISVDEKQADSLKQTDENKQADGNKQTDDMKQADEQELSELKDIISKRNQNLQDLYPDRPEIGENIGELYIPKLNKKLPIFEGTNEEELDMGVGHFKDSVLPGENDNCVLSGHRDTVFRKLGEVGKGDILIVKTSAGKFKYKVNKVRIVDLDDRTVIVPKPRATLTVSTCYPFDYIGSAPKRYILVAYLLDK